MSNEDYLVAEIARSRLTLRELCRVFDLRADEVVELVEFGVVEPVRGRSPSDWYFSATSITRVRRALRLRQDLHIDYADLALVLDLLEEVRDLRSRLHAVDREF